MRFSFSQTVCRGVLLLAAVAVATPAVGAGMSRELARQKVVDQCVYSEWKHKDRRDTAAKRCVCAAKRFVRAMDEEEFAAYVRRGKMSRIHAEKWNAAMDKCD